jgi:methylenetetrahydrofolate reductase (NADPH)
MSEPLALSRNSPNPGAPDATAPIAAFMRGWSLEVTSPSPSDLSALVEYAPRGTEVFLSAVPRVPDQSRIEIAALVRKLGFEPIPHIAARNYPDQTSLGDTLSRAADAAEIRSIVLIAGDRDRSAGPFNNALQVIESGLLQRHGIQEIGIAGYPDGHSAIAAAEIEGAMLAKIAAAGTAGLRVRLVTQFCFDAAPILAWLHRLRREGIDLPVRVGIAGPTPLATLLRFAQRCGVRASIRGLQRLSRDMHRLLADAVPDEIVRALAAAKAGEALGEIAPHFYAFGGGTGTARWAAAAAAGRLASA